MGLIDRGCRTARDKRRGEVRMGSAGWGRSCRKAADEGHFTGAESGGVGARVLEGVERSAQEPRRKPSVRLPGVSELGA